MAASNELNARRHKRVGVGGGPVLGKTAPVAGVADAAVEGTCKSEGSRPRCGAAQLSPHSVQRVAAPRPRDALRWGYRVTDDMQATMGDAADQRGA